MDLTQPTPNIPTQPPIQPQPITTAAPPPSPSQKPFLVIGIIFLLVLTATGAYFLGKSQNGSSERLPLPLSPTSTQFPYPSINPTTNWKTYQFALFPLSFKYPNDAKLTEKEDNINQPPRKSIELNYKNSILSITPDQKGLGFENPDLELNTTNITLGANVFSKIKIFNKKDQTTSFLLTTPYPTKQDYLIMITYTFPNGAYSQEIDQLFDQILSTFKFIDQKQTDTSDLGGMLESSNIPTTPLPTYTPKPR